MEILEIQDWNDSDSSDDSGTLPDRVLSDSDDEEDYPGFNSRSRSHYRAWLRRTVFRTPGYCDGPSSSAGGVEPAPGSQSDGAAQQRSLPVLRFGAGLPVVSPCCERPFPLRFGKQSQLRAACPQLDVAGLQLSRSVWGARSLQFLRISIP